MSIQLACLVFLLSNFSILNLIRPSTSKLRLHVIVLLFKERNKRFQSNIVTYPDVWCPQNGQSHVGNFAAHAARSLTRV